MTHGYLSCSNIKDHLWNEEGIETRRSISQCKCGNFFLESNETADTAGEDHTHAVNINIFFADAGILYCFIACDKFKLAIAVDLERKISAADQFVGEELSSGLTAKME